MIRFWFRLLPDFRVGIPAVVEKNQGGQDMVLLGYVQEPVDALLETFRILLPGQVVQEDAHSIHPGIDCPAQLALDCLDIEGVRLPHFELVDGGGGDESAAHQPGQLLIPGVDFFDRPSHFRHSVHPFQAEILNIRQHPLVAIMMDKTGTCNSVKSRLHIPVLLLLWEWFSHLCLSNLLITLVLTGTHWYVSMPGLLIYSH